MAAKWRRRSEASASASPPGPTMNTRNKRGDHPSPAYGSPAAELIRGANGKRTDNRGSPAWHGGSEPGSGSGGDTAATAEQVNELLANNQRAFAARFASPRAPQPAPTSTVSADKVAAAAAAAEASLLMPPPHLPTPAQLAAQQQQQQQLAAAISMLPPSLQQTAIVPPSATAGSTVAAAAVAAQVQAQQQARPPGVPQAQAQTQEHAHQVAQQQAAQHAAHQRALAAHQQALLQQQALAQQQHAAAAAAASGVSGAPEDEDGDDDVTDATSSTAASATAQPKRRPSGKKGAGGVAGSGSGLGTKGGGGRWTKEEDSKLRAAVQAVGCNNWQVIASDYLGDTRTDVQCLHRWLKVLQPGLVKGPWTKEEDQIIIDCIETGITKWAEIADRIPGRIGKQCRERWFNHLDPSLKKGGWTEEEDAILVEAQGKWGNSWTKIAKLLDGRSENAVKNRWNSATRRRQKATVKTTDKFTIEAIALVSAADAAEKAAERDRAANGGSSVSSRGHAEDEDTECVPRSAIALLRTKREEARRAMDMGLPPPDNAIGLGLKRDGPVIHPVAVNPSMDAGSLVPSGAPPPPFPKPKPRTSRRGGSGAGKGIAQSASSASTYSSGRPQRRRAKKRDDDEDEDEEEEDDYEDEEGDDDLVTDTKGDEGAGSGDGGDAVEGEDEDEDMPSAPVPGLHDAGAADPSMGHLFQDPSLTERERDLIYRAYLAGIGQSAPPAPGGGGGSPPPGKSGHGGENVETAKTRGGSGGSMKFKFKRGGRKGSGGTGADDGEVQWDFQTSTAGSGSGGGAPVPQHLHAGFLQDYGIEFPDDVQSGLGPSLGSTGSLIDTARRSGGLEDDLELSSSLLTMSLDKDIPIDEMGITAGERSLLGRPIAEDAMAAIVGSEGGGVFHLSAAAAEASAGGRPAPSSSSSSTPSSSGRRLTGRSGRAVVLDNGPSHSPSGPLVQAGEAGQPEFGIDSGGGSGPLGDFGPGGGLVPPSIRTEGAGLSEDSPTADLLQQMNKAGPGAARSDGRNLSGCSSGRQAGGGVENSLEGSFDMFDPSQSADLASSSDLVDLVNSPTLLWSVGSGSSLSPSNNNVGAATAAAAAATRSTATPSY